MFTNVLVQLCTLPKNVKGATFSFLTDHYRYVFDSVSMTGVLILDQLPFSYRLRLFNASLFFDVSRERVCASNCWSFVATAFGQLSDEWVEWWVSRVQRERGRELKGASNAPATEAGQHDDDDKPRELCAVRVLIVERKHKQRQQQQQ